MEPPICRGVKRFFERFLSSGAGKFLQRGAETKAAIGKAPSFAEPAAGREGGNGSARGTSIIVRQLFRAFGVFCGEKSLNSSFELFEAFRGKCLIPRDLQRREAAF
ncbi:MAG: hypothetical protein ABSA47_17580 [Verrucomicrobiota bacterium]